ncbi:ABC transporter permease [Vibrio vulnificus]|uniref:Transport permease protein n=1 Tax=Vibrio vulnificus (strain CMCP6) TaxID=216895 RepID=A0A3Q0KYG7_VIBVU|nr:ABC transporter permease [Vibrio vulnificus]AAO07545.1 ABC-type multidrug transport system, permease component [Vibrio vulnificus CMCP6]ADV89080.1 ABC-type multidrug transport system, permease component [Vibrio vulnificus MO6-24/O]AIL73142.1 multidrug ABC transporter permease [Vibrio vulnificus]EGR0038099.1 ABC transporter permease [Vibrio vulnificus]EGR0091922.1 ABC transporter permease [Vibrio vulnificus]
MNALYRMKAIMVKEFRQLSRDRITFGMVVMIPLIQLLLFGYAINTDIRDIPVAVVDQSESTAGRILTESVKVTQVVSVTQRYATAEEAEQAIQDGIVRAALILPNDLTQRMAQGRPLGQWIVDGSDTMISAAILGLQTMPLTDFDFQIRPKLTQTFEVALYYNPSRRSAVNIVPGLLGVILTMTMILFTSAAIVRERERGNLELLITTPVRSFELMVAKIVPYIFVGLIQVFIILGLGHVIFGVPINGSVAQILLGTLLFIAASLTLGLVISTIANTQLQAMQMTVFILLPSILLSGFMFPYEGMPVAAQWIAEVLPATHFMRMIRGIVLRGADLFDLWRDTLWMIGFTLLGLIIASTRFKKSLD